jgi:probable H4MPT-linked C1 transfer pathway protein
MTWLGLDIGGANLKAADGCGWASTVPFALWRDPQGLASVLSMLINSAPAADGLAITMTGELCDSFRTKPEGVRHILAATRQAAGARDVRVYLVDGRLVPIEEAVELPYLAAASNWHALAWFACHFVEARAGLLIDIGSTTTDIIPLIDGQPRARASCDTDRLLACELVYTGVGRTPICAIVRKLPWQNNECPIAAELFATAVDAYVMLEDIAEDPSSSSTADGRPLTKEFARERLARMICADAASFSANDAERAAAAIRDVQITQICSALRDVTKAMLCSPDVLVLSGQGEFLAAGIARAELPAARVVSMAERIGRTMSLCASAHSVAVLARERF